MNDKNESVPLLLKQNIDIKKKVMFGKTALHTATENNNNTSAQHLLTKQLIEPNIQDYAGNTQLHLTIKKTCNPCIKLLLIQSKITILLCTV